jgi:hypothetical protein
MFKKLWYSLQIWFVGTKFYEWAVLEVIPFIRFTTYYALPDNKKFIQWGALERKGYKFLKPGYLIFTIDNKKLTAKVIGKATADSAEVKPYFIPSHAALCIAKDRDTDFEIAEMTHHDYTRSTWEDVCREATRVVIARCTDWDETYVNNTIIPMALSFKNKKYDNKFQMSLETLACSELPYHADIERRAKIDLKPVVGNKPYITPVGWVLGKNIEIVWDSDLESV